MLLLASKGVEEIVNYLIDAAQAKLFHGPVYVSLWWFGFYVDPNTKIDVLQEISKNPPRSKKDVINCIHKLTDDDMVEFSPHIPIVGGFKAKVKISQIEDVVELIAKKLGI